jgi:hypothetical protein
VQVKVSDTIIFSASPIPGNTISVVNTIDRLMMLGAKVIYGKGEGIHVVRPWLPGRSEADAGAHQVRSSSCRFTASTACWSATAKPPSRWACPPTTS